MKVGGIVVCDAALKKCDNTKKNKKTLHWHLPSPSVIVTIIIVAFRLWRPSLSHSYARPGRAPVRVVGSAGTVQKKTRNGFWTCACGVSFPLAHRSVVHSKSGNVTTEYLRLLFLNTTVGNHGRWCVVNEIMETRKTFAETNGTPD